MTHEEFESLVRRLERDAAAEPSAYRRRLTLLALLGYAYVLAVLLLLAGAIGATVWLATISATALLLVKKFGWALLARFFDWYAPLFSAYSFAQARQQEFEADRIAAEAAGAPAAAAALVRVNVLGGFLGEKFWPAVFKRAMTDPEPALAPFSMLGRALQQPGPRDAAQQWLGRSLARRTGYDDTHPCLADRLQALGIGPFVPPAVETNAAEAFLGSAARPLTRELDERWRSEVRSWWSERHRQACEWRARLAELERTAPEALELDALWERACLTEELGSSDAALELLTLLLEHDPFHAGAHFRRGRLLLEREDARGIEDLQAAAKLDASAEEAACALIAEYHRRHGRHDLAEPLERRCRELEERAALLRRERETVRAGDEFVEHDLELATVSGIAHRLGKLGGVRRALLVRKRLDDGGEPLYVLGILSHRPWWRLTSESREQELIERVSRECGMPGETLVVSLRLNPDLVEPLAAVPYSRIYPRG